MAKAKVVAVAKTQEANMAHTLFSKQSEGAPELESTFGKNDRSGESCGGAGGDADDGGGAGGAG